MMSHDVDVSATIITDDISKSFQPMADSRLGRDPVKDLHYAIDITKELAGEINKLHPEAASHIKYLILGGKFI
jgi:hypothetical protein